MAMILALLMVLGSVGYFAKSIQQIIIAAKSERGLELILRILQLIIVPLFLLMSGLILFFQGWRLAPSLLIQQFLMCVVIAYLIFLDIVK